MAGLVLAVVALVCTASGAVYNVKDFGAIGDGRTLDSAAISRAISMCSSSASSADCIVFFPSGTFLSGTLNLTSHMTIQLDPKATILGSPNPDDYALVPALPSYPITSHNTNPRYAALLAGHSVRDVLIKGGGTIDGQGKIWWDLQKDHQLKHARPCLVEVLFSESISIEDVTLKNSGFYALHPVYSNNLVFSRVTIDNPIGSPNTDGLDPDSSTNVLIKDCVINSGDDHISVKSGQAQVGTQFGRPSANITITGCKFGVGAGLTIGSETAGGIYNVTFRDSSISASQNLVRLKSCTFNGGVVSDIRFENIQAKVTDIGIFTNLQYECPADAPINNHLPIFQRISLSKLTVDFSVHAGDIKCFRDSWCQIDMQDVNIGGVGAFACQFVNGTTHNVKPKPCY